MTPPKLDPMNQRVVDLGKALFGARWHSDLARLIGVSRPYVSLLAKGKRPVTPRVRKAIVAALKTTSKEHRRRAYDALAMLANYKDFKK
jgi:DNA-binding transcriptional regulator YdaS (Cro superfamily)